MFRKIKDSIKKFFQTVNQQNSTMGVQCVASKKCGFRFTTVCDNCKKNIGVHRDVDEIFYESK